MKSSKACACAGPRVKHRNGKVCFVAAHSVVLGVGVLLVRDATTVRNGGARRGLHLYRTPPTTSKPSSLSLHHDDSRGFTLFTPPSRCWTVGFPLLLLLGACDDVSDLHYFVRVTR